MSMDLKTLIGHKWFLTLDKLAERAGVGEETVRHVVRGEKILPRYEEQLRKFLENYKGE